MTPSQAIACDDWAEFPAIAAALDLLDNAKSAQERSDAQDALFRAELERDVAIGLTDLWNDWQREQAIKLGLIKGGE